MCAAILIPVSLGYPLTMHPGTHENKAILAGNIHLLFDDPSVHQPQAFLNNRLPNSILCLELNSMAGVDTSEREKDRNWTHDMTFPVSSLALESLLPSKRA